MSAQAGQQVASLSTGALAATLGAAAGGAAGAATAFNADMNNRALHPDERRKAAELARKSGGKYTQREIEEQMRLMGNAQLKDAQPNTTTVLTNTEAIVENLKNDPGMPKAVQGSVVVEVPGKANSDLQDWIIGNTKDVAGYIPGQSPYTASNAALNAPAQGPGRIDASTAKVGNSDVGGKSGVGVQQNAPLSQQAKEAIADGASNVSRQAGVVAAGAIAAAPQGGPYGRPAQALAVGATVIGVAADAVEQMARPDTGQTLTNLVGSGLQEAANNNPIGKIVSPITNEAIEAWKNSGTSKTIQDWVNDRVNKIGGAP